MNEVLRQENKYFITRLEAAQLSGVLRAVMSEDSHNGALGYKIRSLYFDTPFDDDYNDKIEGLELRQKIRLRTYDPMSDFAMLEMKQKQGAMQKKRSLRLSREDAVRMTKGDYTPLLSFKEEFAAELYGLMTRKVYRPKTIVEYDRLAFVAKENKTRVTFDNTVRSTENSFDLFDPSLSLRPALDDFNVVMEVKYNGFLLSYLKDLLRLADRSTLSVSKYCLARTDTLNFSL